MSGDLHSCLRCGSYTPDGHCGCDERERDDRSCAEPRVALPYGWRSTPLPMSEDEYDHRADNAPERWEQDDE